MGDIINLREARKSRARRERDRRSAENRAVHGISKADRQRASTEEKRSRQLLDSHRRTAEDGDEPA